MEQSLIHRLERSIEKLKQRLGKLNECLHNNNKSERYASLLGDTGKRDSMTLLDRFRALRDLAQEYTKQYKENKSKFAALKTQRETLADCLGDVEAKEYPEQSKHACSIF
jgi:hypothetical protein